MVDHCDAQGLSVLAADRIEVKLAIGSIAAYADSFRNRADRESNHPNNAANWRRKAWGVEAETKKSAGIYAVSNFDMRKVLAKHYLKIARAIVTFVIGIWIRNEVSIRSRHYEIAARL